MRRLIERVGPFRLEIGRSGAPLLALARSIVYQQLTAKAAKAILGRFRALFDAGEPPDARAILAVPEDRLRACGLSRGKIASLRDLCARVVSGQVPLGGLDRLPDPEVSKILTSVRGIGRWSAEMFLMFHLGRLDVWPSSDLGIRKAVQRLYGRAEIPSPEQVERLGEAFRPYRTVASWYLWRLIDQGAGDW